MRWKLACAGAADNRPQRDFLRGLCRHYRLIEALALRLLSGGLGVEGLPMEQGVRYQLANSEKMHRAGLGARLLCAALLAASGSCGLVEAGDEGSGGTRNTSGYADQQRPFDAPALAPGWRPSGVVDAHVHFDPVEHLDPFAPPLPHEARLASFRAQLHAIRDALPQSAERILLITPSYNLGPGQDPVPAQQDNMRIGQIVAETNGEFLGLCGVPIHRSYAIPFARDCLAIGGMVGVKVRNFSLDPNEYLNVSMAEVAGSQILERFIELVRLVGQRRGIILAHFSGVSDDALKGDPRTTALLLAIMDQYPNATLIIAHAGVASFIGLDGLEMIGRHYADGRPRNVYLDTSMAVGMGDFARWDGTRYLTTCADLRVLLDAWRRFGIDYVLYGSDYTAHGNYGADEPGLHQCRETEALLQQLMVNNAHRLLSTRVFSAETPSAPY